MKKQIPSVKAHLIRGAFYGLLFVGLCAMPLALGQRGTKAQSPIGNTMQLPITSTSSDDGRYASVLPMPGIPMGGAIWSQYDNPTTQPPINIGSQQFESAMATFDDQAADDFIINAPPPPIFLYIDGVRVMGEYSQGGGPASSFNVYFYTNGAGNVPGTQIAAFLNQPYTGSPPDFVIHLSPFSLPSGTYWVSVQARQDFNPSGQWFWHNRTVQSGNAGAAWQNPGNGYGTGCITWNRKNTCMPDQVWPDQVFQILGFPEGPTPTATPTASQSPIACALFEDFDNVTPPTLPVGWIASNAINPDGILWQTSNSGLPSPPADSLPNAAWVNDPSAVSDKRLDSPPVRIELLENAILTFRNNYAFKKIFDGGVLEISIDGGAFQDIIAAGGTFLQGGYNGSISTCCGNPLAGRQAWIGTGPGFTTTTVDMNAFQGHTIVLRWRMGSDNSLSGLGWRIDTVQMLCERPTPTATPTATATCCQYMPSTAAGIIEPGTTDIGNHCDNCTTIVPLPFTVHLYGQIPLGAASVSSNGNLQFLNRELYAGTSCPLPDPNLATAILPYQDDLRTDQVTDCSVFASGCGVFTSTTGTAPNRAFNIEWRAAYSGRSGTANFEVRFYENQNSFDIFYGATADNGGSEESGVQAGVSVGCPATTFSCHTPTLTNGLRVTYTCGPPFTPTPTATVTATPTATHSVTTTPTATPCPTISPTPSDTPTPTPIAPRVTPTARPRPSPRPRP